MGDNGESHQDALDADEMLILRDFLRAWHDCMGKMKKTRAEAELKMRAMRKRINANIQAQSRKLTIAVTFQKWQEYGGVRRREREDERRQRKLAAARLAQAKRKPTAGMLKRRASVLAARKSSLTGVLGERKSSFLISKMKLAEYSDNLRKQLVSIYEEKNRYKETNKGTLTKIEELRRRQMKALAVTRDEVERWGEEGRRWATENIEKGTSEVRATTVALRDTIFSTDIGSSNR
ncbi:hypothetical protein TrCOL_g398 [Triparma columacea]|uniref:Uncharacterized protein n=1 Tax=Triparma columacea TaxID=722753 RepID=A0A9W7GI89_9STRA|nr:hypothetical protein TrCOL_g398 [Triparma columacea]